MGDRLLAMNSAGRTTGLGRGRAPDPTNSLSATRHPTPMVPACDGSPFVGGSGTLCAALLAFPSKAERASQTCHVNPRFGRDVSKTTDSGNSAWRKSRYRLIRPSTRSKKLKTEPRMGLPVGGRPSQAPVRRPAKDHHATTQLSPATMRSTVTPRSPMLRRKPFTWATRPARPGGPPNAWLASSTMSALDRSSISSSRPRATTSSRYVRINVSGFISISPPLIARAATSLHERPLLWPWNSPLRADTSDFEGANRPLMSPSAPARE